MQKRGRVGEIVSEYGAFEERNEFIITNTFFKLPNISGKPLKTPKTTEAETKLRDTKLS